MPFQKGNTIRVGKKCSEETRRKIGNANRGKKCTEEHRRKISEAGKGRVFSEQHKKKIGEASKRQFLEKGNPFGDQSGENHPLYGKKHSAETKRKMSESGKKRPPKSAETRKKISEAHKGKKFSEEHKRVMREAFKKRPQLSKEVRQLIGRLASKTLTGRRRPPFSKQWLEKMSEAHRGKKSNFWKGGVTPLINSIRHCFKARKWKTENRTRDDYTCQVCGKRGGDLHVDHYPKSFAQIFYNNKITSLEQALECEEFWNTDNGRTLCIPCHKTTDTYMKKLIKIKV